MYSHVGSVRALLATPGINVNIQGFDGLIPLKVATKFEIIAMLKKYTTNCEDYPIHSFGKVILCGDTGSGKTTLAQVIASMLYHDIHALNAWVKMISLLKNGIDYTSRHITLTLMYMSCTNFAYEM